MAFGFFKKKGVPDVGGEERFDEEKKPVKNGFLGKFRKKSGILESEEAVEKKEGIKKNDKKAGQKIGSNGAVNIKKDKNPIKEEDDEDSTSEKPIGAFYGVEDKPVKIKTPFDKTKSLPSVVSDESNKMEFSKINARIESINSLLKGYNERFSTINQQIGELRATNLSNEKNISKMSLEGRKAVDIVKEVKPEQLRIDYQRIDAKVSMLNEKIEGNKQFMETVMNEVKDLRRKAGIFIGTDALLRLNEEVKKDLVELQKMSSRVKLNSDKSEQIFVELQKGFTENQKLNEIFNNLDDSYSNLQKNVEKMKIDFSNIVSKKDFNDFQKKVQDRILSSENTLSNVGKIRDENERLAKLIETILAVVKKNEEDIADIAVTIGDENIKKVSDYDERFNLILKIIGEIADEVKLIRGGSVSKKAVKKKLIFKKGSVSEKKVKKKLPVEPAAESATESATDESTPEDGNLLGISEDKAGKWRTKDTSAEKPAEKEKDIFGKPEPVQETSEESGEPAEKQEYKKPADNKKSMMRIDSIKDRIKNLMDAGKNLNNLKKSIKKRKKLSERIAKRRKKNRSLKGSKEGKRKNTIKKGNLKGKRNLKKEKMKRKKEQKNDKKDIKKTGKKKKHKK